ncbi:MAG: flagellar motor stator protein MotA [Gammaproteobacteria bacterium]
MLVIIGYAIVIFSVFGGFALEGGSLYALFQPYELLIIGGAALGAFIVGNNPKVIKSSIKGAFSVFKGANYSRKFYIELLSLFFELTNKIRKEGVLSIEADIENYKESPLFSPYKLVTREDKIMEFICDHLRLIVTGRVDVMHLELLMDQDIETFEHEGELPINAITKVADSLPAFGIVAAVMGVVTTMQMINGSAEELGAHVAKALVGTFLGILIGYGFTAPIAAILENRLHAVVTILQSIKVVLLASVHNLAPTIAVEFARKVLYSAERPTSNELEIILKEVRANKNKEREADATKEPEPT